MHFLQASEHSRICLLNVKPENALGRFKDIDILTTMNFIKAYDFSFAVS